MSDTVAIVGAGIAGLSCARVLRAAGRPVWLFDKGRKYGGRVSSRRAVGTRFDHGAQYFTARSEEFRSEVQRWVSGGHAARWSGRIVTLTGEPPPERERYVGTPGMSGVATALAAGLEVRSGLRIQLVERTGDGWRIEAESGATFGGFGTVVVAVPAVQAEPLLAASPDLASRASMARLSPCIAAMLVPPAPLELDFDGAFVRDSIVSWVARNSSKPGRSGPETWVLHGSPGWSTEVLERAPASLGPELLAAFVQATGVPTFEPKHLATHRWRYANAVEVLPEGYLLDADRGLAACGDWCRGGRIEDAWWSGRLLGQAIASA